MIEFESADEATNPRAQQRRVTIYRFDIFKGVKTPEGKIVKIKSVGSAFVREGLQTYTIHLKTLLKDTFYLLPNTRENTLGDYVILTREPSQKLGKKYFWNNVGVGNFMQAPNESIMHLSWDVMMADDIYMTLEPIHVSNVSYGPASSEVAA
jgi:hypothetical protein